MNHDVYFAGVGGQGILTIGRILADLALQHGLPSSFYPSKGIAQRGGFVKAQLRLGKADCGPNIPERGADVVVAMERSEALKVTHFARPDGDFLLFNEQWAPTAVALGKAPYPSLESIFEEIHKTGVHLHCVEPDRIPDYENEKAPANLFVLGALLQYSQLKSTFSAEEVREYIKKKWKNAEPNLLAFNAGLVVETVP